MASRSSKVSPFAVLQCAGALIADNERVAVAMSVRRGSSRVLRLKSAAHAAGYDGNFEIQAEGIRSVFLGSTRPEGNPRMALVRAEPPPPRTEQGIAAHRRR